MVGRRLTYSRKRTYLTGEILAVQVNSIIKSFRVDCGDLPIYLCVFGIFDRFRYVDIVELIKKKQNVYAHVYG